MFTDEMEVKKNSGAAGMKTFSLTDRSSLICTLASTVRQVDMQRWYLQIYPALQTVI